ncbi:TPA: preprotein translocase subunit SecG [Pasteurella multocida]|uniref:Protein-export membrane protein SecG n=2 Tax=Pasteurella multocida TaxID=747 RepID=SECG_PASMU|nr:preprotein translocase subunit SecG [Pasteurella multocida]Q9CP52.1 RecName: Full=Protein-export membrane protein SecG [Pasteurella multocida subsp. multocida str. Pm70]AWW59937.1 protein-export membrane protein SecG [Pasteurellaceae bacterium 12591]AAK02292.1 SecG [Pasteurella multocida subsp. multocida str. Pm70]AET15996.1 protein-export membrane protein SecG [Pasteurella multocida 36950]AFI46243.1 protein-export membrane protein SecG [Pasteurella multocida subsp. multocida str. 3480]AHE
MYQTLLLGYAIIAIVIVFLILIQQGKGADAGASFGGGASGTIFGSVGSGNFLSKMTALLATAFFVMSIVIGNVNSHRNNVKQGKFDDLSATAEQIQQQQKIDAPAVETKNSDIPQ